MHPLVLKHGSNITGDMTLFFSFIATGAITERTELFGRGHKECSGKLKLLRNGIVVIV